jgi:hypothetical protein
LKPDRRKREKSGFAVELGWNGKKFYPELVFGVIRKARLKKERLAHAVVVVRRTLKNGFTHQS